MQQKFRSVFRPVPGVIQWQTANTKGKYPLSYRLPKLCNCSRGFYEWTRIERYEHADRNVVKRNTERCYRDKTIELPKAKENSTTRPVITVVTSIRGGPAAKAAPFFAP